MLHRAVIKARSWIFFFPLFPRGQLLPALFPELSRKVCKAQTKANSLADEREEVEVGRNGSRWSDKEWGPLAASGTPGRTSGDPSRGSDP